jgi:hypothetical protein
VAREIEAVVRGTTINDGKGALDSRVARRRDTLSTARQSINSCSTSQPYRRTFMWLHPDVFWIGVLHAKEKGGKSNSED